MRFTLLHDGAAVRVLSHLQQDLLHVSVLPGTLHHTRDLLLETARDGHELRELTLRALVHLVSREHVLQLSYKAMAASWLLKYPYYAFSNITFHAVCEHNDK